MLTSRLVGRQPSGSCASARVTVSRATPRYSATMTVPDAQGTTKSPIWRRWWAKLVAVGIALAGLVGLIANGAALYDWFEAHFESGVVTKDVAAARTVAGADVTCGAAPSVPVIKAGWGPERATYSVNGPYTTTPTLNSITDNPNYGDERVFFDVKSLSNAEAGGWCTSVRVSDGALVVLRVYVENSAGYNPEKPDASVARGVTLSVKSDPADSSLRVLRATLRADNTTPSAVFDEVELVGTSPFRIDPIAGSARVTSNVFPAGIVLSDRVWTTGALLGTSSLDGNIRPLYEDSLIVTLEARVTYLG